MFLYCWLKHQGKLERFGLCKPTAPAKAFLFYIPLIVITLQNVWHGGSLWPCVISHCVLNSLSAFSAAGESMVRVVILCVLVAAYAVVLLKTLPKREQA